MMNEKLQVIKIGGDIVDKPDLLHHFLNSFSKITHLKILVHGGGILLNDLAEKLSIPVKVIDGRRITDSETLDLALMTYSGLINTKIVAKLNSLKCQAVGLNGADGGVINAVKRPVREIDYGLVGDITDVNSEFLKILIGSGHTPVLCALSCDQSGQMLNTNADTIAAEIAIAMASEFDVQLTYVLDKPGVLSDLDNSNSIIRMLNMEQYKDLKKKQKISGGMLPKLHTGFYALQKSVSSVNITNIKNISGQSGTQLQSEGN
jgi:acetylglutamate kinase